MTPPRARLTDRPILPAIALALLLGVLAMARPVDHDESQYVAAAVLAGEGLTPWRDFAYLQTPLQPLLFGPLAAWLDTVAYPGLRLANAALGALAILFVFRAGRAGGASPALAAVAAALFAGTDILLFGTGLARNDALPVALFAAALWLIVLNEGETARPGRALLIGLLLAAAACGKASYALPAAVYGLWALANRERQPLWVAIGALPPVALLAGLALQAPDAFWFDVLRFPVEAPRQYYQDGARAFRLALPFRLLDLLLFLALGAALPALALVARDAATTRRGAGLDRLLELLVVAGLIAALLPEPVWRQYLLPALPPLFVRLARLWRAHPPGRAIRILFAVFAGAGLTPSLIALAGTARDGLPMEQAMRDGEAIGRALDAAGVIGDVATLAPQFLPAAARRPDRRFATGPFYFRSRDLLGEADEQRFHLVSANRLTPDSLPPAVLLGGEAKWAAGNPELDKRLEQIAGPRIDGVVRVNGGRFRLLLLRPAAR